ncbi:MAG: decarboxylating 6-phosphogluconate dehydrogenase [Candidatus Riflebacteria bacterium]|nr:decarboxylating 6-phosphogluconate dehydrogenase [Candidatus Riflebacteria bacterium]
MEIGFIGLGRMGLNMVKRIVNSGHRVICTARTDSKKNEAEAVGATWASSYEDLVKKLSSPRIVWTMVPSGQTTEEVLKAFTGLLEKGDLLIDGGNSDYRDSIRRTQEISSRHIEFMDVGTSGGIWGLKNGYCLMVGGTKEQVERVKPIFEALAPADGWGHVGQVGSGHYVKMVHNAIEYGMMQAYAEGFELLETSDFQLNLNQIAALWNKGSVVRSWLLELVESMFSEDQHLEGLKGFVDDSGEARWAVEAAISQGVPVPAMALSLFARFSSRKENAFSNRFLAALRNQFGGHLVHKKE